MSVSLVARRHGIGGNQIFTRRRLMAQGALTAATADKEVVPASEYRALEAQVRELHREGECREERRHAGWVAVDLRSTRWCSDGLEITCDNGEKVRVVLRRSQDRRCARLRRS